MQRAAIQRSPSVRAASIAPALLGFALLFAPRPDLPAGYAPDHRDDDRTIAPLDVPPTPRFALAPRTATCDGGDGTGRATPLTPATYPGTWVVPDDYPASALRAERQGRSGFSLAVDETGRVAGCAITRPSGTGALDAAACVALTARARFHPARDAMGCPIPARFVSSVLWQIPPG